MIFIVIVVALGLAFAAHNVGWHEGYEQAIEDINNEIADLDDGE